MITFQAPLCRPYVLSHSFDLQTNDKSTIKANNEENYCLLSSSGERRQNEEVEACPPAEGSELLVLTTACLSCLFTLFTAD
jgi:hypothetical protein